MRFAYLAAVAATALLASDPAAATAVLKAQYLFANSLASSVAGAPDLVSIDPTGINGFVDDTVVGQARTVFKTGGSRARANQGGLLFDSTGLLTADNYSVALTLKFNGGDGQWRRILDTQNRANDGGLYVNPSNNLAIYPGTGTESHFTSGEYRNVVLTVSPGTGVLDIASAYIDGGASLTLSTQYVTISPTGTIGLFLDDGSEWAPARIAAVSFYDGVLSATEIARINGDPLPVGGAVPEPATWATMALGFGIAGAALRRRKVTRAVAS